jgi:glutathione synthase/RimK-type ligase-like ATP-grasp enzyme
MSRILVLTDSRYLAQRMPAALVEALRRRGIDFAVVRADRLVAEVSGGWAGVQRLGADLLVPRARNPLALALLCRAELDGVPALNPWSAVQAVPDKPHAAFVLAETGVPTPRTFLTDRGRWPVCRPGPGRVLLKPAYGDNGRGIVRVDSPAELERLDWREGLVLAQHYVDVAGVDLKLYGAGEHVWAVRRPSPLVAPAGWDDPVPVRVTRELRDLAVACRDAFGLELYGVDVLPSADGPLVVDVNDFPNYTGVAEAPDMIADVVQSRLPALGASSCRC